MLNVRSQYYGVDMATADTSAGENPSDGPSCARDFIAERLREADSPMSPAELAEEYGCSNGHMRNVLADLLDAGVVERVHHGQYTTAGDDAEDESEEVDAEADADSEGNAEAETDDTEPEEPPQEPQEVSADRGNESESQPSDGETPSEDPDGPAGNPAGATEAAGAAAVGGLSLLAGRDDKALLYGLGAFIALLALYLLLVSNSDEEASEDAETEQESEPESEPGREDVALIEGW